MSDERKTTSERIAEPWPVFKHSEVGARCYVCGRTAFHELYHDDCDGPPPHKSDRSVPTP